MSLEDVYTKQVKGQTVRGGLSIGTQAPPIFERDPNIRKLEQDVFAKIHEIAKPEPLQQSQVTPDLQFVSMEDAIKELAQMNK